MKGLFWGALFVLPLWAAVIALSGCGRGLGFRTEIYQIDEMETSTVTYDKPLECVWGQCPEQKSRAVSK